MKGYLKEKIKKNLNKLLILLSVLVFLLLFILEEYSIIPQFIGFILLGFYFFLILRRKLLSFKELFIILVVYLIILFLPFIYVKKGMSKCYPVNRESTFINIHQLIKYGYNYPEECKPIPEGIVLKPVIYLYPQQKQKILVQLDYKGKIFADYPEYNKKIKGWKVIAYPNGKIINNTDNQEYSYLFWEGIPNKKVNYDLSKGFIVRGKDTKKFLQETLSQIGLTPKEYNEFIVYWFPKMQNNKYNLIHFAGKKYTDTAPLNIIPKPDSMLRVFMVYKPLDKYIKIQKQIIKPFKRKGFTVIEWGGSELK